MKISNLQCLHFLPRQEFPEHFSNVNFPRKIPMHFYWLPVNFEVYSGLNAAFVQMKAWSNMFLESSPRCCKIELGAVIFSRI